MSLMFGLGALYGALVAILSYYAGRVINRWWAPLLTGGITMLVTFSILTFIKNGAFG